VRARQNRQKERLAAQHAERRRVQLRRRRVGGLAGVILLVIVVAVGLAVNGNSGSGTKVAVSPPSSSATTAPVTATTVALASVKGKPCVGLKDPLPKGAPAMLLRPGPAPTKLSTQDLKVGTGAVVPKNAKVTVNYVGVACSTGKIFDSSYSRNQTFDADLGGGIIPGWQQGIPGMRIGGVRLLAIPPDLAYGSNGQPPIAPDEALYFLVAAVKLG
jgi:peptidylprolyl isomerase